MHTTLARSDRSWFAEWWRTVDHGIITASMILIASGMLLTLAAGPTAAATIGYSDEFHFVYRQAGFSVVAIVLMLGASMLSEDWVRRIAAPLFVFSFLTMAVLLLIADETKGAQRWIRFAGFSLQPSEIAKPALIILSGWLLAQKVRYPDAPWAPLAFIFFAPTIGLLLLQPDVGQSVLLTATFVITFFVCGLPLRWAAGFAAGGAALGWTLYTLLPHVRFRIASFADPAGGSYQLQRANDAISRGGLLGVGPGEGEVKAVLPDPHTDFIYAVAGEEFGFIACLGMLIIFAAITLRGIFSAARRADPYPRAVGTALFAMFGMQALINIGVNVGLLPTKGMTLPFISYGGSSMIGTALTIGFGLALTRRRPEISIR